MPNAAQTRFRKVLEGQSLSPPPIWLMRQAGRYLPEYRATRAEAGSFLDLCFNVDLATEVTLQPIRRYDFDAAIIFSDILVIPMALGQGLRFAEGEGPLLDAMPERMELNRGRLKETLDPVYAAIGKTREALSVETSLIGFAGAPWTLACYMIDQRGKTGFPKALEAARGQSQAFVGLIDLLTETIVEHLSLQVQAGADVIQVFDTWAGLLQGSALERFSLSPMLRITGELNRRHPEVPVILFPREVPPEALLRLAEDGRPRGLTLDPHQDPAWAAGALQKHVALQGNLAPAVLRDGGAALDDAIDRLLATLGNGPYVMNLGHGVVPETPPEHVAQLVSRVRGSSRVS